MNGEAPSPAHPFRLGLVVNPCAGLGGAVALKGSDGAAILAEAQGRGARPHAAERAARALAVLQPLARRLVLHVADGAMGADSARRAGLDHRVVLARTGAQSTAEDTVAAARALSAVPVDLLLFAGGDGTARDICRAVGTQLPVLGIPAGVKMHSAVYAVSPEAAGELVRDLLDGALIGLTEGEVRDLDEDAFRAGQVRSRPFGTLRVPADTRWVQRSKIGETAEEAQAQDDIAATVLEDIAPGELLILGPGSTTMAIKRALGIEGTLLGVDAVSERRCLLQDATEAQLLAALRAHEGPSRIVVTAIGGQGHVFGRGNQPISAAVIREVGVEHLLVVATRHKIAALAGRPLLIDTDDPALDRELRRYLRVVTGYRDAILYPAGPGA